MASSLLSPTHIGVLDPWAVLRDLPQRWAELDLTHIGSLIAIAGCLPSAWRLVHHVWREGYAWIRQVFVASVTLPAHDPLNRSVVAWLLAHRPRHHRAFTGRTDPGRGGGGGHHHHAADRAAALKKTHHPVRYSPHWDSRWLWYRGVFLMVVRDLDGGGFGGDGGGGGGIGGLLPTARRDPSAYDDNPAGYGGSGGGSGVDLTISCLGWSAGPVMAFIEACRDYAHQQTEYFVIIYARDPFRLSWSPKARKPIRQLDTVHFDAAQKAALLADLRNYLDPRTERRYRSRSMPYRRGYLFYGPPGTGKSSLSIALAGEFGLDLYEVKIPSVATDYDLEQMFLEIPPRCVVLLEDIDAVWADRSAGAHHHKGNGAGGGSSSGGSSTINGAGGNNYNNNNNTAENNNNQNPSTTRTTTGCTLSGLLNVLDGVGSQEGRIVIMTTNWPDHLDSALVRPGRVDLQVYLGNISRRSAEEMFLRMFSPDLLTSSSGGSRITTTTKTPDHPSSSSSSSASAMTATTMTTTGLDAQELKRLAAEFASHVPDDTFTPSHLQGFFQLHLESAQDAAGSIVAWVERELAKKRDKEFELLL